MLVFGNTWQATGRMMITLAFVMVDMPRTLQAIIVAMHY